MLLYYLSLLNNPVRSAMVGLSYSLSADWYKLLVMCHCATLCTFVVSSVNRAASAWWWQIADYNFRAVLQRCRDDCQIARAANFPHFPSFFPCILILSLSSLRYS